MARCLLCFNITDENDCISLEDRLENEENSTVADIIRLHFEFIEVRKNSKDILLFTLLIFFSSENCSKSK